MLLIFLQPLPFKNVESIIGTEFMKVLSNPEDSKS